MREARSQQAVEQAAYEEQAAHAFMPSKDSQELFMAAMTRAFDRACEALLQDHAALARTEHDNERVLNNRCCPVLPFFAAQLHALPEGRSHGRLIK